MTVKLQNENSIKNAGNLADILVSICLYDLPVSDASFSMVERLANLLDSRFSFREIILVVQDKTLETYLPLINQVADVRLLAVSPSCTLYDCRVIAAEESIGDIVLLGSSGEVSKIDVLELLFRSIESAAVIVPTRSNLSPARAGLGSLISALGRIAGFNVNMNDLQTIVAPRSQLNQLLSHTDPDLALRFPPRNPRLAVSEIPCEIELPPKPVLTNVEQRLEMLQKILAYMAPTLLNLVALSSALLVLSGLIYAIYVLFIWAFMDDVVAGWASTSMVLSLSLVFIGFSLMGLSLGVQNLINQSKNNDVRQVVQELNRVDLFGKVASDLNANLESGSPASNDLNS